MTMNPDIRQQERIVNAELARLLREQCGLDAQAETIVDGRQPDVLVMRPDKGPVIIETEFAPARSVNDDALAKLGLAVRGETTRVTFAVTLPAFLREVHQRHLAERLADTELQWMPWYSIIDIDTAHKGDVFQLSRELVNAAPPTDDLEEAVSRLEAGAQTAGATLYSKPGSMSHVANVFDRDVSDEVANMAALMVINAMVFHDRLSSASIRYPPPPTNIVGSNYIDALKSQWNAILQDDYYPIFRKPLDVLEALPIQDALEFVRHCRETADAMAGMQATGRHDLSGQIFNRLVADRKFLAAYYTSIPAATLLAGLALDPARWPDVDWSDIDSIREFTVLDPACGTGTLLMAAYQQILHNHRLASQSFGASSADELHRALIEDTIHGADVVDAAIHITASTLAAMSPVTDFEQMNVHIFPLGLDGKKIARLGSLEWLEQQEALATFSGTARRLTSKGDIETRTIPRPAPRLSIVNPPFRRHNSGTGEGDSNTRVFGNIVTGERELAKRLSQLLADTPSNQIAGLASAFVVMADRITIDRGRIAFVLPATCLSGSSWRKVRQMLSDRYQVECVVSSHDTNLPSMSYDTSIAEILLIAKKVAENNSPTQRGRFVNLWKRPSSQSEAVALLSVIKRALDTGTHRIDGPPVGGTDIMLGSDRWGEIVESPIGRESWIGARWRNATCGQYAYLLSRGALWNAKGQQQAAGLPIEPLENIAGISPYDLQVKGTSGAFNIYDGWDSMVQYPALWKIHSKIQTGIINEPNARLSPKVDARVQAIWDQSGHLHVNRDVGYGAQPVMATITVVQTLGVRSWYTLQVRDSDKSTRRNRETALALWFNTTLGMLCHANHANRSQIGRGTGSRTMLRTLPTLDVRKLSDWQLDAADDVFSEFREVEFKPFYMLAVDPNRIRLDERFFRDVLGFDDDAIASVARIRSLLAAEPSIHGNKKPALRK